MRVVTVAVVVGEAVFLLMIHRSKRQPVAATLAFLFGALCVLGHALHLLPGVAHFDTCGAARHCGCEHATAGEGLRGTDPRVHAVHDCPICSFLTMAKNRPPAPPPLAGAARVSPLITADAVSPDCEIIRTVRARGPPRLSSLIA